jgi:hypothetical protein
MLNLYKADARRTEQHLHRYVTYLASPLTPQRTH